MKKVILFKDFVKLLADGLNVKCTEEINNLIDMYHKQEIVISDSPNGYMARFGNGYPDEIIPEGKKGDDTTNLIHGSIFFANLING